MSMRVLWEAHRLSRPHRMLVRELQRATAYSSARRVTAEHHRGIDGTWPRPVSVSCVRTPCPDIVAHVAIVYG